MTGTLRFLVSKSRQRFLEKDEYTTANAKETQRDF